MPPSPIVRGFGSRVTLGFFWTVGSVFTIKAINTVGQIALAWLLVSDDFGQAGVAFAIASFTNLIREAGLTQILIHRHRAIDRWANPAFWMSASLGVVSSGVLLVAAPVAAWVYESRDLFWLLVTIAGLGLAAPFGTVPTALLHARMRFAMVSGIAVAATVVFAAVGVGTAAAGLGAMSFILAHGVSGIVRNAMLWVASRPAVRWDPQLRRWKYLIGSSGTLLGVGVLAVFINSGAYMILGLFRDEAVVGVYYFAFLFSAQAVGLIGGTLNGVLFPALSQMQDARRQSDAFIRSLTLLAFVVAPVCLLQAGLARDLLSLLFFDRWADATPLVRVLAGGMYFAIVAGPASALVQARGRFGTLLNVHLLVATLFAAAVTLGAATGGAEGTAWASGVVSVLSLPIWLYAGLGRAAWRPRLMYLVLKPLLLAAAAVFPAVLLSEWYPPTTRWGQAFGLTAACGAAMLMYAGLVRTFARPVWDELAGRGTDLGRMLWGRWRRPSAAAGA